MVTTGCGSGGLYDVPLPGGADLGDRPYRVTAHFADVLDLVPQAAVKVNDVAVGRVDRITLAEDNTTAVVDLLVNGDVRLPGNAAADLRQSSLLGEKYISLRAPAQGQGSLDDGAVIPRERTNRNPEIEEVLGALSLLLNGGGVGQVADIVGEVNAAMSGNEDEIRAFLSNVDTVVTELDGQKGNITRAIDSLNRLSGTLAAQTDQITGALDHLAPGLKVVADQRDQLVTMLGALDQLSATAVDTVNRSKADLVQDLKLLAPTLEKLAASGANLPNSLQLLLTYPFTDYTLNAIQGDFTNVDVKFDLDLSVLLDNINSASTPMIPLPGVPPPVAAPPQVPALPLLPSLPIPQVPTAGGGLLGPLLGGLLGGGG
ncbi:MCE-family lipoprotein LprK (MCE-family lipoprotein Mce1e) [Alloactinosynnema sp. L-07]|uniref:MCE family protein n=1 Tax=Alloactinosynnema sp. L-07 TaxID=1653480 RepID=UPI00065F04A0|nr:MCE family protein [Alloactinosynnema sp. L-07]CRK59552.1 MCE-family lipoprotein LprK (MCE-family lipoprotein Mce1e) [Alloactinosynnema sp. L-07]